MSIALQQRRLTSREDDPELGLSRGTRIRMTLDPEIFGSWTPWPATLRRTLFDAVHLFPGLRLTINSETFSSDRGLQDLAEFFAFDALSSHNALSAAPARGFHWEGEQLILDFAFAGEADGMPRILSWVNGSELPTMEVTSTALSRH